MLVVDVSPEYRAIYDIVAIVLCFPAIVCMGVAFKPPAALKRVATVLGDISYPVYMLHFGPLFSFSYLASSTSARLSGFRHLLSAFVLCRSTSPEPTILRCDGI